MKQVGRIKGEEQSGSERDHGPDAVSMCVLVIQSVPQRVQYRAMACPLEHAARTDSQSAMVSAQQPIKCREARTHNCSTKASSVTSGVGLVC